MIRRDQKPNFVYKQEICEYLFLHYIFQAESSESISDEIIVQVVTTQDNEVLLSSKYVFKILTQTLSKCNNQ